MAAFITCIGPKALAIHNGLPFQSKDEKKNLAKILKLWESYCLEKTNIIYEIYCFNNCNQDASESIDTYASNLRFLAGLGRACSNEDVILEALSYAIIFFILFDCLWSVHKSM